MRGKNLEKKMKKVREKSERLREKSERSERKKVKKLIGEKVDKLKIGKIKKWIVKNW